MAGERSKKGSIISIPDNSYEAFKSGKNRRGTICEEDEKDDIPGEMKRRESKINISDIKMANNKRKQSIAESIKFRIVHPVRRLSKNIQDTLHGYASKRRGKLRI
jgi:hypothetical protein